MRTICLRGKNYRGSAKSVLEHGMGPLDGMTHTMQRTTGNPQMKSPVTVVKAIANYLELPNFLYIAPHSLSLKYALRIPVCSAPRTIAAMRFSNKGCWKRIAHSNEQGSEANSRSADQDFSSLSWNWKIHCRILSQNGLRAGRPGFDSRQWKESFSNPQRPQKI
jgi:hypothetical protein